MGDADYELLDEKIAEIVAWKRECDRLRGALEEIARLGVSFDAKGTQSQRVNNIARAALASSQEQGTPEVGHCDRCGTLCVSCSGHTVKEVRLPPFEDASSQEQG